MQERIALAIEKKRMRDDPSASDRSFWPLLILPYSAYGLHLVFREGKTPSDLRAEHPACRGRWSATQLLALRFTLLTPNTPNAKIPDPNLNWASERGDDAGRGF